MPTLLQINSAKNVFSTGKIAEQIGIVAQEYGWDCYIASSARYTRPGKIKHIKIGGIVSEYIHAIVWSKFLDKNGQGSYFHTKKLIHRIEEIKPDIIHLHNIHGHYINYKLLFEYLQKTKIPVVWTLHDCWAFTGGCPYFEYSGCDGWLRECNNCDGKRELPRFCLKNRAKRSFALKKELFTSLENVIITPVSKWLGDLTSRTFLSKYPITPIYNGIDTNIFQPSASDLRAMLGISDKFVLLAVSSIWNEAKGLSDYRRLARKLSDEEQMVLIGVPDDLKPTFPDNVIIIAKTENQKELVKYYTMADAVLNLSYQETFGLTTVEAMACGTPAIVYNRTASPELVTPETGEVIEPGNLDNVLDAIKKIRSRKKTDYHANCRQRAIEFFDKKVCYNQYINLYNKLIDNHIK